jgi:hypothetical protein
MVGVPVVVAIPGAARVIRSGDHVDVVSGPAGALAEDVLVLSVQTDADALSGSTLLYVAASPTVGRRLAGVPPDTRLTITVRPP